MKDIDNIGVFNQADASKIGLNRMAVHRLVKAGKVVKLGPNVYRSKSYYIDPLLEDFAVACKRMGPKSAIGGATALQQYGLTDDIVSQTWLVVPAKVSPIPGSDYKILRSKKYSQIGVVEHKDYRITSVERTIIDCFIFKRSLGVMCAATAYRRAIKEGLTRALEVYALAEKIDCRKYLIEYWEALNVE